MADFFVPDAGGCFEGRGLLFAKDGAVRSRDGALAVADILVLICRWLLRDVLFQKKLRSIWGLEKLCIFASSNLWGGITI